MTRAITPWGRGLAFTGAALFLLGLGLGNYPFLLFAAFLAAVAAAGKAARAPELTAATRAPVPGMVQVGESVDVHVGFTLAGPLAAPATIHDRLDEGFVLDRESNFHVLLPGDAPRLDYGIRAAKRGKHHVGPATLVAPEPLFVAAARTIPLAEEEETTVQARAPAVRRLKAPRGWGRTPTPGGDAAKRGALTNDFRELRPYAPGDPLKSVNWKATARASTRDMQLVVNDYEVEGKKAVWVFVDGAGYTARGTTFRTAFDELAEGALTIADHFLDRGHRVGMTLYGGPEPRVSYAEAGEAQSHRLHVLMAGAEPAREEGGGLERAVEATRGFLARERPLVFVLTLLGEDLTLEPGLLRARALASTGRRAGNVVLLSPDLTPEGASPGERLVRVRASAHLAGLERKGVTAIRWQPRNNPLPVLLARGVLR